jgi:hypothetical protein
MNRRQKEKERSRKRKKDNSNLPSQTCETLSHNVLTLDQSNEISYFNYFLCAHF